MGALLNEFPNLLLSDRMTPISNEIGLVELPFGEALEAYLDWQRSPWVKRPNVTSKMVSGDLETILHALEPMRFGQHNRTAIIPTASGWTAFFDNRDVGPYLESTLASLSNLTGRQTLLIFNTLTKINGVERKAPFLDGLKFHLRGPVDRYLQAWINDSGRWTWDEAGDIQPFERPELYEARRKKDRLTIEIVTEYAAALGLRPFDAEFYAPEEFGAIVEIPEWKGAKVEFHSLAEVQERLARGWHNPSHY